MKNLSFFLGTFLFLFSYCQTPVPSSTRIHQLQSPSTSIKQVDCSLKASQVVGYLDFVACYPEVAYCAHFLVPEYLKEARGLALGTNVKLSGKFSLEGTAPGNKYYYLLEDLRVVD